MASLDLDLTKILSRSGGVVVAKDQVQKLNLTLALNEDIWTELLSELNLYTQSQVIISSSDYLQQILLNNIRHRRYKQPVKRVRQEDYYDEQNEEIFPTIVEEWLLDGVLHRDPEQGPVSIRRYENGNKHSETWYHYGQKHRDDNPAYIEWNDEGTKIKERWYQNNFYHRTDGPAMVNWYWNGQKQLEIWWRHGQLHRDDKPAEIAWEPDGSKSTELWYQNHKLHRDDGPAEIWWHDDSVNAELWYQNNQLHRADGPAYTKWDDNGNITIEEWWLNGQQTLAP